MAEPLASRDINAAARLVKTACRGSDENIAAEALRAVKQFARRGDAYVELIAEEMWGRLSAADSRVRFLILQLSAELWPRSTAFRKTLVSRMVPEFVQLVGGDRRNHELPEPAVWAERLPGRALELVEAWSASHGQLDGYRNLSLARRYIIAATESSSSAGAAAGLQPSTAGAASSAAPSLSEQRAQRWREKYEEVRSASVSSLGEIRRGVETMEACLRILAPSMEEASMEEALSHASTGAGAGAGADGAGAGARRGSVVSGGPMAESPVVGTDDGCGDDDEGDDDDDDDDDDDGDDDGNSGTVDDGRGTAGLGLSGGAGGGIIDIDLAAPEQRVEADRAPLLDALRDALYEAQASFEPRLRSWLLTLSRVSLPAEERPAHTALLQRVTALRARLKAAIERAHGLKILETGGRARHDHGPLRAPTPASAAGARGPAPRIAAAAGGAGGAGDGDSDDGSDEFEDEGPLKPGYEPNWVDPDQGWERPPPEAMRSPPRLEAPGPTTSWPLEAAAPASAASAVEGSDPEEGIDSGQGDIGGRRCGAARLDGSLCVRRVPACGACAFHGQWVARRADGRPVAPAAESIWERVARDEGDYTSPTGSSTAEQGGVLAAEATQHSSGGALRSQEGGESCSLVRAPHGDGRAAERDGRSRKRPLDPSPTAIHPREGAASASSSAGPVEEVKAPTQRRGSKAPLTAREKLAAKLAASARAVANANASRHISSADRQHRSSSASLGW